MNMNKSFPTLAVAILLAGASLSTAQDTVFFTGFEYSEAPVIFEPAELNGADGQIGEWSGDEFPEGQGDILFAGDAVGILPSPYGGTLMLFDRASGDFDTSEDVTGSYFADFTMPVGLLGAEVSFDVGTRRTQGNNEKDYDIIGRDSSGVETFHLRVGTNNNGGERLGVVTDDGATVIFDLPTTIGEDQRADLDNMGGFSLENGPGFGAEIANIVVRLGEEGFVVDFSYPEEATSPNANAYRTALLPYNGDGVDLAQLEFTYEGSTANGRNSGYVLDNILVTGFDDLLQGDFNFDGVIDVMDFQILAGNFGTGTSYAEGDYNFDATVGLSDFVGLKATFLAQGQAMTAAIPEPAGLTLALFCGAFVACFGRRKRRMGTTAGLIVALAAACLVCPEAYAQPGTILGTGTDALLGGDLTDPENDGAADEDLDYNATFRSNAEPGFGGGEFSFNVFDNLLGPGNAKWCCGDATVIEEEGSLWVEAELQSSPIILTHFTVSSANDVPGRDPIHWAILGSNDGENYDTIFEHEGESLWDERLQVRQFTGGSEVDDYLLPETAYTIFRMETYATGIAPGGAFFQIGEIEFFGVGDFTPGDFNDDGAIDLLDYVILRDNFGETFTPETSVMMGDFNGDLSVDLKDFAGFRQAYNEQQAGAAAVPEPASFAPFALAIAMMFALRRRRLSRRVS